jgi:hypothetical protein
MRVFSIDSLLENMEMAGFLEIYIHENNPDFGIIWGQNDSLVISMRKKIPD